VHRTLASVYHRLQRPHDALRAQLISRDLDPPGATAAAGAAADQLDADLNEVGEDDDGQRLEGPGSPR
jgi:hypothetical protein